MAEHEALAVFVGDWHAEGTSYGGPDQSPGNPRAGASPWTSIHTARWHSGGYFVVHDERANGPFDTLSLMGWESERYRYFVRAVENHGFTREYDLAVDGRTWNRTDFEYRLDLPEALTCSGASEAPVAVGRPFEVGVAFLVPVDAVDGLSFRLRLSTERRSVEFRR